jgi:hypothetical protein
MDEIIILKLVSKNFVGGCSLLKGAVLEVSDKSNEFTVTVNCSVRSD